MTSFDWRRVVRFAAGVIGSVPLLAAAAQGPAPAGPAIAIVEPLEGSAVTGEVRLTVAVTPPRTAVTDVTMSVDGRELCTLTRAPWQCAWDAGRDMREHHLRVVATLADGQRLVANRRTPGVDVNETIDVAAVQVPVIVHRRQGSLRQGPEEGRVHAAENGKQRIDTLIDDSLPLELITSVDISASMEGAMPQVQAAVKRLLSQLRPGDTTTLLGFNETIFVLAEREQDPALRDAAVEALVPWGGTAFYDATVRSLELVSQKAGRRGVIIFSDGDDRHSVGRRDDSLRRIEEGQVVVYTVGFGEGASEQFRGTLKAFAAASGGRAFFPRRPEDLQSAFASIFDELSHQYILSFIPDGPADGGWRRLEVTAKCDGCRVRAREGYRAAER